MPANSESDALVGLVLRGNSRVPRPKRTHALLRGASCQIDKAIPNGMSYETIPGITFYTQEGETASGELILVPGDSYERGKFYKHGQGHSGPPFIAKAEPVYCFHYQGFLKAEYGSIELQLREFGLV